MSLGSLIKKNKKKIKKKNYFIIYKHITSTLQAYYKRITSVLQAYYKHLQALTSTLQAHYKRITSVLQALTSTYEEAEIVPDTPSRV